MGLLTSEGRQTLPYLTPIPKGPARPWAAVTQVTGTVQNVLRKPGRGWMAGGLGLL